MELYPIHGENPALSALNNLMVLRVLKYAGTVIEPGEVKQKVLEVVIPPDEYVTLSQLRVIEAATRRANQLGIQVQVLRVR
ncbi:hypothetical protein [Calidithermus chliarophilus]|uniref:hypothetical protein n=1 Tax=Calidithermus chliarophilus TaxID=52023 RepID=UPI0012F6CCE3|nr:hypothetical protein [Calidithermus chliarophilus]